MAHRKEINRILRNIESVDYAVIAHSQTITVAAGQPVMRKRSQPQSHLVNLSLNPRLNGRWKLEEASIKACVKDLKRCAHLERSRFALPRTKPRVHFALGLLNILFKLRRKFQIILDPVINPFTNLAQFRG
jgi:hypothetical protein